MSAPDQFPHEIEMGGGPNIIVHSQGEHDAFLAAARANGEIMERERNSRRMLVVALCNSTLERPEAPLCIAGPFDSSEAATEFAAKWNRLLTGEGVSARVGRLPMPEDFEEHVVNSGAFDLADEVIERWPSTRSEAAS